VIDEAHQAIAATYRLLLNTLVTAPRNCQSSSAALKSSRPW